MSISNRLGLDPDLVRAIMYMETTHGWYDAVPAAVDGNDTIRPMNVGLKRWQGYFGDRETLRDPYRNIWAGPRILSGIISNLPEGASVEEIATLYQNLQASKVSDYGAQVERIYEDKPWEYVTMFGYPCHSREAICTGWATGRNSSSRSLAHRFGEVCTVRELDRSWAGDTLVEQVLAGADI